jgi:hypothetical protein
MAYNLIGADDDLLSQIVSGLGNTELVGYDDDDVGEIGATRKRRSGGTGGMKVDARKLSRARRMAIGFGPTALAASSAVTDVSTLPQVVFRPERLFIPSDIAFDIVVIDVKIGNRSQLVAAGALPGAIFSEVSVDVFTHWDTAEVGNQIVLTVQNINTALARTFRASMIGAAAIA